VKAFDIPLSHAMARYLIRAIRLGRVLYPRLPAIYETPETADPACNSPSGISRDWSPRFCVAPGPKTSRSNSPKNSISS
jgi:hypothetical protein